MELSIVHSLPHRVRFRYHKNSLSNRQVIILKNMLIIQNFIESVSVNNITGSVLVCYCQVEESHILSLILDIDKNYMHDKTILDSITEEGPRRSLFGKLVIMMAFYLLQKLLPMPIRRAIAIIKTIPRVKLALNVLYSSKKLKSEALDAASLTISILNNDYNSASNISFLLDVSEVLEEHAKKISVSNLKDSLMLKNEMAQLIKNGEESRVHVNSLSKNDIIIVRKSEVIPVDGEIIEGDAVINEASITGESNLQESFDGRSVYAGTTVEDGEISVLVKFVGSNTKISKIVDIISDSNLLKASAQKRSENIADAFVPYNFILAILTYIVTKDIRKASSTIMVDYSCAMKLSAPIVVFSALRDASKRGHFVKGGKFLESLALSETIVFDKTGTLTKSEAKVSDIVSFGEYSRKDVLRIAACLEEHFPHSLAKSVVRQAEKENLNHKEEHAKVDYIVAHGISSTLNGKSVIIGSEHFIFEDIKVKINDNQKSVIEKRKETGDSILYLVMDKNLIGIISIHDPIRDEAKSVIKNLREFGVRNISMITGDSEAVAKNISLLSGIDNYKANAFPEDKIEHIENIKNTSNNVIMVGDGVNDAPALSVSDVGIVMHNCSDIAKETSDIILSDNGLNGLVDLHILGNKLLDRIEFNNNSIIVINSGLILTSLLGFITPSLAALLHNISTTAISVHAMRKL